MRRGGFEIVADRDFAGVVRACADRPETWINGQILNLYLALHRMGRAHSLELWEDGVLRGGTYGVVLGRALLGKACSRGGARPPRSFWRIWWPV